MYARDDIAGRAEPLTFGVSGKLIMNALVMYDRETGTLWSQILGKAVDGELRGVELTPVPAIQTTWSQWQEQHPDSVALAKGFSGSRDSYESYYRSGRAGVLGETNEDTRLPRKTLGIGVVQNDEPVYYPYSALTETPVVNDTVGDELILVVCHENSGSATLLYSRQVDGQVLAFEDAGTAEDSTQRILRDRETGTLWNSWLGVAIEGELAGTRLERIPATSVFWFGWSDFHPETRIYGAELTK